MRLGFLVLRKAFCQHLATGGRLKILVTHCMHTHIILKYYSEVHVGI